MKTLIAALCLVSTIAVAQDSQPPTVPRRPPRVVSQSPGEGQGEVLPENYQVTLVVTDKDKVFTEISLVAATTNFSIDTVDPRISFSGTMAPDEQDGVLVRYDLGITVHFYEGNSEQYRNSSARASVRVRLGEPIQILKSGSQTYKLTISRFVSESQKRK